jgi:hypothetical protein
MLPCKRREDRNVAFRTALAVRAREGLVSWVFNRVFRVRSDPVPYHAWFWFMTWAYHSTEENFESSHPEALQLVVTPSYQM